MAPLGVAERKGQYRRRVPLSGFQRYPALTNPGLKNIRLMRLAESDFRRKIIIITKHGVDEFQQAKVLEAYPNSAKSQANLRPLFERRSMSIRHSQMRIIFKNCVEPGLWRKRGHASSHSVQNISGHCRLYF